MIDRHTGVQADSCLHTSKPFMSGSPTSSSTRSGWRACTPATASAPVAALSTVNPSRTDSSPGLDDGLFIVNDKHLHAH